MPDVVSAPRQPIADAGRHLWADALAAQRKPGPITTGADDLA